MHEKIDLHQMYSTDATLVQKNANYSEIKGKDGKYRICPRIYNRN